MKSWRGWGSPVWQNMASSWNQCSRSVFGRAGFGQRGVSGWVLEWLKGMGIARPLWLTSSKTRARPWRRGWSNSRQPRAQSYKLQWDQSDLEKEWWVLPCSHCPFFGVACPVTANIVLSQRKNGNRLFYRLQASNTCRLVRICTWHHFSKK